MNNVNVEITVECFVEKDGKHLMLRRHPSKRILPNVWIAPGGHQEPGEGLFACTRREIKEETGLEIKNIRLRAVGRGYLQDINTEFAFHILTATYASGELISNPADGELIWLTPEEMLNLDNVLEELKPLFPLILNENNGVISVRAAYGTAPLTGEKSGGSRKNKRPLAYCRVCKHSQNQWTHRNNFAPI